VFPEEYGKKGFEKSSLTRMMKFSNLFPDELIKKELSIFEEE